MSLEDLYLTILENRNATSVDTAYRIREFYDWEQKTIQALRDAQKLMTDINAGKKRFNEEENKDREFVQGFVAFISNSHRGLVKIHNKLDAYTKELLPVLQRDGNSDQFLQSHDYTRFQENKEAIRKSIEITQNILRKLIG